MVSKKTPLIFGRELAKIQLTQVFEYSFGDFVSPVCQYLDSWASGVFFYGILDFLHKNGYFEQNRKFRYLTDSISHPNFLFLVDMCIQLWEIDREWFTIINLLPPVLLLGSNWRKIGRMLLIFTVPHFYLSSQENLLFDLVLDV